jgi:hypothetical protein
MDMRSVEASFLSYEAAQLVVGAAALDGRYRRMLIGNRRRALNELSSLPGAPSGCQLSERDRAVLCAIPARTFAEFARGVERLCLDRPGGTPAQRTTA